MTTSRTGTKVDKTIKVRTIRTKADGITRTKVGGKTRAQVDGTIRTNVDGTIKPEH